MNAQEVDLAHLNTLSVDYHANWDARDKARKFAFATNTDDPFLVVVRWREGPFEEGNRVIEAELAICVFHIVLCEQVVHLFSLRWVLERDSAPFITSWKGLSLNLHLIDCLGFDGTIELVIIEALEVLRNWLGGPELVLHQEWDSLSQLLDSVLILVFRSLFLELSQELQAIFSACDWVA